ncbi:hypothetical protein J2D69_17800 [Lysinibacillus sphaericus]|uniref:Uncharacterized protein n=3 Tax=Lysinibacillus TaxID=400634 RepID=B1HX55_LYSSC|nr:MULTISPECIES: hypothetical protein [Lysinibacillus]MBE5084615.1 hypothetical protein [Bacillus thuringiensis]ACA41631.1 hypothetical protein Bsph_4170 [Lysinibacillus sphaericus C3-41]AMO32506.1 hypothetical protein AR327_08720 [Lysinibacillus sphaericus]AMR92393.1 hypothetical protein A1T07_20490 [Lysinibacillus sphaericus]ANA46442.1 hypothetical protein A2J09_13160 [Lysinibacillus sphaericus]
MNQTIISEAFGEQLALITADTPYEIESNSDTFISELEHKVRKFMYSLWMDAQANKLANYLEKKQAAHFAQLYEFSYGISSCDNDDPFSNRTDTLALMIIDEKAAYKKRIERIRLQYKRFNEICELISVEDSELFIHYFEQSQKVDYETLRNTVIRNLTMISERYWHDEQIAEEKTKEVSATIDGEAPKIVPRPDMSKRMKRQEKLRKLFAKGR